jgi:hypothetical protein
MPPPVEIPPLPKALQKIVDETPNCQLPWEVEADPASSSGDSEPR